jgi:hypothetical protein
MFIIITYILEQIATNSERDDAKNQIRTIKDSNPYFGVKEYFDEQNTN